MAHKDYVPSKESELREWEKTLMGYIEANASRWLYPQLRWESLKNAQTLYEAKYALAEDPLTRTSVVVTEKNEAKDNFVAGIRMFLSAYITYNPDVTDADRVAMSLPVRSRTHVHHPITQLRPVIVATTIGAREINLDFMQPSGSKSKPAYVTSVLFAYVISDAPIENPNAPEETFSQTGYFSKTSERMYFAAEQSGKFLCGHACYMNLTAERGRFGGLVCVRIP
jgi:hypothetical protein